MEGSLELVLAPARTHVKIPLQPSTPELVLVLVKTPVIMLLDPSQLALARFLVLAAPPTVRQAPCQMKFWSAQGHALATMEILQAPVS